jgi:Flp pilus assembly protein TadG
MSTLTLSHLPHTFVRHERGLVVIELAIVLPLLVLIMFATAELGRALYQYTTLTKAVESGARFYASNPGTSETTIKNLVVFASPTNTGKPVLPKFGSDNGSVTVDSDAGHITVSADYNFDPIIGKLPIINKALGSDLTMTATQTMRAL